MEMDPTIWLEMTSDDRKVSVEQMLKKMLEKIDNNYLNLITDRGWVIRLLDVP